MIVQRIHAEPPPELAAALADFELQFRYPLGPGRTFRISHGQDYPRFYRAMGDGVCFVAADEKNVLGTLGAARRRLTLPDMGVRDVAYFGDLKVAPVAHRGRVVIALIRAAREWASASVNAAFSVVMDGTAVTPKNYAGRLSIPRLEPLAKIVVFQLHAAPDLVEQLSCRVTQANGIACHKRWRPGRFTFVDGNPEERSESRPQWLMLPDGSACGRLEDTLKAKRLFNDDGAEMRSAHLCCLAYDHIRHGADLIRSALPIVHQLGFDALFVAIAEAEATDFASAFKGLQLARAPATIFGTGLAGGALWNINSAEI